MKKKIISMLLVCLMIVSLFPMGVVAQEPTMDATTLANMIANASDNSTVELTGNVTLDSQLTIDKAITLDGKGYTITSTVAGKAAILVNKVAATIKDLTVSGPNTNENGWDSGEYGIKFYRAAGAKLDNVKVTAANAGILVDSSAVTLEGAIDVSGNEFGGIEVCKSGNDTLGAGVLTIASDATVTCNGTGHPAIWIDGLDDTAGTVTNMSATVLRKVENTGNEGKQIYFWTTGNVAAIDNVGYATLAAAVAAANSGTVKLLADVELSEQLTINKAITLDGGKHTITSTAAGKAAILVDKAAATIQNLTVSGPNSQAASADTDGRKWDNGEYGIKLFKANNATLTDVTVTGANAGIQVNGGNVNGNKVTFNGTITVSGNEFGGIEVCNKGELDISNATLVNANETDANPVLWNDGGNSADNKGDIKFSESQPLSKVEASAVKDHYYLPAQAKVGAVRYATLAEAVAAAQANETVKLLKDVETNAKIVVDKNLTIDLGDKTLTRTDPQGNVNADNGTAFEVNATGAVVTVKNGTIDGSGITAKTNHQDDPYGHEVDALVARAGKLVLESLTVNVKTQKGACAYAFAAGNIEIKSGTYTNSYDTHTTTDGMVLNQANVTTQLITVSGGTFVGKNPADGDDSGKVTSFLASDCISIEADGGYKVISANNAVAEIGGTKYESLQAAVDAATSGAEIKLLTNVQLPSRLVVDKTMTLDLNGKTITGAANETDNREWFVILAQNDSTSFTLTITDNSESKNGAVKTGSSDESKSNIPVTAGKNATIVISGGNYVSQMADECVYSLNGGLVNIYGGDFSYVGTWAGHTSGDLLNVKNDTPVTNIKVYGGTFHDGKSLTGGDDAMGPTFIAPGYVAVAGDNGTFTVKEAQVAPMAEVEVKDIVASSEQATDGQIVVTGFAAGEENKPTAAQAVEAINKVLKNDAVTNFVETKIEEAANIDEIAGSFKNDSGVEVQLTDDQKAAITTKISIKPTAATIDENTEITALTFDVTPVASVVVDETEYEAPFQPKVNTEITFRLPVPSDWDCVYVEITHFGETAETNEVYLSKVLGTEDKYVELSASHFSLFGVAPAAEEPVAKVGDKEYPLSQFQDAIDEAGEDGVIVLLDNVDLSKLEKDTGEVVVPVYMSLTNDVKIQRKTGNITYEFAAQFAPNDDSNFHFVFTDIAENASIQAVARLSENKTQCFVGDTLYVDIILTDTGAAKYGGAYAKVKFNNYVSVEATPGGKWQQVGDYYVLYDYEGGALTDGSVTLGTFTLKAKKATLDTNSQIVALPIAEFARDTTTNIADAWYVPDDDGYTLSANNAILMTANDGAAEIAGGLKWADENPTIVRTEYNGSAWGTPETDYTATVLDVGTNAQVTATVSAVCYSDAEHTSQVSAINVGTYYVLFTATAEGYAPLVTPYVLTIVGKQLTAAFDTNVVYSYTYDGKVKTFAKDENVVLTGYEGTDLLYAWENQTGKDTNSYSVKCTVTVTGANAGNYKPAEVSGTFTISDPDYVVYKSTDYIANDYEMVYVFVNGVARPTYTSTVNNVDTMYRMYKITDLGYGFTREDSDSHDATGINGTPTEGWNVYACLIKSTNDIDTCTVTLNPYNSSILGTVVKSVAGANDVNGSKKVDLADAVAVVTTRSNNITEAQRNTYMATIIRADADRNGKVEIVDANDTTKIGGDAAVIKAQIAPVT